MPGPYSHRDFDCERASSGIFRVVGEAATAYLDADRVLTLLVEDATSAERSEEELTAAVHALAARHGMRKLGRPYG